MVKINSETEKIRENTNFCEREDADSRKANLVSSSKDLQTPQKELKFDEKEINLRPVETSANLPEKDPSQKYTQEILRKRGVDFDGCTNDQCDYIVNYANDMVAAGYKREFGERICKSMAILYRSGIEGLIPERPKNLSELDSEKHENKVKECWKELLKVTNGNGGSYKFMHDWATNQPKGHGSWSDTSKALKYYLLSQLENQFEITDRYYLKSNDSPDLGSGNLQNLEEAYEKIVRSNAKNGIRVTESEAVYANTVVMFKAYTAIALNKETTNPFIDRGSRTCTLIRSDGPEKMKKACQIENFYLNLEISDMVKGGVADSMTMGPLENAFYGKYNLTRKFKVPFSRIFSLYYATYEFSTSRLKTECEVVVDFARLRSKVVQLPQK
jgi:hypothetical protein